MHPAYFHTHHLGSILMSNGYLMGLALVILGAGGVLP